MVFLITSHECQDLTCCHVLHSPHAKHGVSTIDISSYNKQLTDHFVLRVMFIFPRVRVTLDWVFDRMIGFIAPYIFTQFGTAVNTVL
jgi:hypothetical protein